MSIGGYIALSITGFILFVFLVAALIGYFVWRKSYFVCEKCGYSHKPKYFKFLFAWHMFDNYLFTCPNCGETCAHTLEIDN